MADIDPDASWPIVRLILIGVGVPFAACTASTAYMLSGISWSPALVEAWLAVSPHISDSKYEEQGAAMTRALRVLCALPLALTVGLGAVLLALRPDPGISINLQKKYGS